MFISKIEDSAKKKKSAATLRLDRLCNLAVNADTLYLAHILDSEKAIIKIVWQSKMNNSLLFKKNHLWR